VDVDEVLRSFPALSELMGRRAGLLSGGEQLVLALAGALVADPEVVMLGEMGLGPARTSSSNCCPRSATSWNSTCSPR